MVVFIAHSQIINCLHHSPSCRSMCITTLSLSNLVEITYNKVNKMWHDITTETTLNHKKTVFCKYLMLVKCFQSLIVLLCHAKYGHSIFTLISRWLSRLWRKASKNNNCSSYECKIFGYILHNKNTLHCWIHVRHRLYLVWIDKF